MVSQKEIFYTWLLAERDDLEYQVSVLQQNLRYRKNIDPLDCVELQLALERKAAFEDFYKKSTAIFGLSLPADLETGIYFDVTPFRKAAEEIKKQMKREGKK